MLEFEKHQPDDWNSPKAQFLQAREVSSYYEYDYRIQVAREMLAKGEAMQSLLVDDLLNTVNKSQYSQVKGVAGYLRCSLPAAELALVAPAHVVSMVPPFPEEVTLAEQFIQNAGGSAQNLTFWLYTTGSSELTNLSELLRSPAGQDAYRELIRTTARNLPDEAEADHFSATRAVIERVSVEGRILLLPFQTRQVHHDEFHAEVQKGRVSLMDVSDRFVNKYEAAETLLKADPSLARVLLNPIQIEPNDKLPTMSSRISDMAERILDTALQLERQSGPVYIKLDGAGVSGIDNLSPSEYTEVYEGTASQRLAALRERMQKRFGSATELPAAVIEKRVDRQFDKFGVREYVASGVTTGSGFSPWCFVRAINDSQDAFQGVIGSTSPEKIGIDQEDLGSLAHVMDQIVAAMNSAGYEFGYVAKDVMLDGASQSMKVNDHNDRRGGRSFVERILVMFPDKVVMDKDYEFEVPKGLLAIDYAMDLTTAAVKKGHFVYGTCMNYYPTCKDGKQFVKLKIVSPVPDEILENGAQVIPEMAKQVRVEIEQGANVHSYQ